MQRLAKAASGLRDSLERRFPEHHFTWHRAQGALTIRLGTWQQLMGIGSATLVAGWLGIATTSMISGNAADDTALAIKQQELVKLERALAAARSEAQFIKSDVSQRADRLEARHDFLSALLSGKKDSKALAALLPRRAVDPLVYDAANASAQAIMPPLMAVESQQLALVDKATGATEARLRDTQALIRRLGLDPKRFTAASDWRSAAMGGPFVPAGDELEPRFKDLYTSWRKLETMQASLASIPAMVPVKNYRGSSSYGQRVDPFNGRLAMHAGADMAGSHGEPIYAAANGRVERAGVMNGYGIMAEIDHGKGIETRYGHMSKILVKPGQMVRQGDMIGRMGSTGRSTGTHLHYEVRIDGRAVNPKPFLEASSFVLAAQGEATRALQGPAIADRTAAVEAEPKDGGIMMTPIRIAG